MQKIPSVEESLKTISWQLKCLVDEIKILSEDMRDIYTAIRELNLPDDTIWDA